VADLGVSVLWMICWRGVPVSVLLVVLMRQTRTAGMCYDGCMLDEIAGTASMCDFTLFECGYSVLFLGLLQMASTLLAERRWFFSLVFFPSCLCSDMLYFLDLSP
jgi:hypothetical protein